MDLKKEEAKKGVKIILDYLRLTELDYESYCIAQEFLNCLINTIQKERDEKKLLKVRFLKEIQKTCDSSRNAESSSEKEIFMISALGKMAAAYNLKIISRIEFDKEIQTLSQIMKGVDNSE